MLQRSRLGFALTGTTVISKHRKSLCNTDSILYFHSSLSNSPEKENKIITVYFKTNFAEYLHCACMNKQQSLHWNVSSLSSTSTECSWTIAFLFVIILGKHKSTNLGFSPHPFPHRLLAISILNNSHFYGMSQKHSASDPIIQCTVDSMLPGTSRDMRPKKGGAGHWKADKYTSNQKNLKTILI